MRFFTLGLKKDLVQRNKKRVVDFAMHYPNTEGSPDLYHILVELDNHLNGALYREHFNCLGFQWSDEVTLKFNECYEEAKKIVGDSCPDELKGCELYDDFEDQLEWIEKNILTIPPAKKICLMKDESGGSSVSLTCA
jgi:hypothetical protein